jgi:cyclic pyranopterin phosphate synthase
MPVEEMEWMPQSKLMNKDEILTLAETFINLGVKKIRLTGGEPLVRKEFAELLEKLAKFPVELINIKDASSSRQ